MRVSKYMKYYFHAKEYSRIPHTHIEGVHNTENKNKF